MTRALAVEGARYGITANAVAPGSIDMPMARSIMEGLQEKYRLEISMERVGEPDELVAVIEFLASKYASYVTGQFIYVCEGANFGG